MHRKYLTINKLLLVFVIGLVFLGFSKSFAACINDMSSGTSTPYPSNAGSSGACWSYATNVNQRYNNQQLLTGTNTNILLKMFNFNQPYCDADVVVNIQTKMQSIGGACSTCIDGKAGNSTRDKLEKNCLSLACPSPLSPPTLNGSALVCVNGTLNGDNCCEIEQKICGAFTQENRDFWIDGAYLNLSDYFDKEECCQKKEDVSKSQTPTEIQTLDDICPGAIICTAPLEALPIPTAEAGCCMPKDKWADCDNENTFYSPPSITLTDLSVLDTKKCEMPASVTSSIMPSIFPIATNEEYDFCACNKPITTCKENYGDGFFPDSNGCCIKCSDDEKKEGLQCICNKIGETPPKGKKLDIDSCKWICDSSKACCGIELNTVVPFIGDCIEMTTQNNIGDSNDPNKSRVNQLNAFPFLMMGLSKILVTVILIFSFLIVIVAGLMMTTGIANESNYKKGMDMVKKVIVALILLGSSGLILKLINPNFFGG